MKTQAATATADANRQSREKIAQEQLVARMIQSEGANYARIQAAGITGEDHIRAVQLARDSTDRTVAMRLAQDSIGKYLHDMESNSAEITKIQKQLDSKDKNQMPKSSIERAQLEQRQKDLQDLNKINQSRIQDFQGVVDQNPFTIAVGHLVNDQ